MLHKMQLERFKQERKRKREREKEKESNHAREIDRLSCWCWTALATGQAKYTHIALSIKIIEKTLYIQICMCVHST